MVCAFTPTTSAVTTIRTRSCVHLLRLRCIVPGPGAAPTSFWVRSRSLQDCRPVRLRMIPLGFSSFLSAFFGLSPPFPSPSFGIWHRQAARGVYPIFVLSPTLLQTLGPGIYTIISIPLPAPFHDFSSITNYPVSFHSSATTCFPHDFMPGISLRHYPLASSSCPHFETEPSEHLFPSACAYRCMRYKYLSHTRVCVRFEAPLDVPSCFHGFSSLLSGPPPVY